MRKVLLLTASRSERPLLEPIIDLNKKVQRLIIKEGKLEPAGAFAEVHRRVSDMIALGSPDMVLVPCDRREMLPAAIASFYWNKPTVHLFAGVYGLGSTDDIARHAISLFSHIMLCESEKARENLISAGEEPWRCHVVGATHFDNMSIDVGMPTKPSPYDLVLVNPITSAQDPRAATEMAVERAFEAIVNYPVFVYPNEDANNDVIERAIDKRRREGGGVTFKNLSRPRFLALLSKAERFISNSSSTIYEAPYFKVPVINPTIRNAERMPYTGPTDGKASERILDILAAIPIDDKLLRKRLRFFGGWG